MATLERYSREEVLRIAGINRRQLDRWRRLDLVVPEAGCPDRPYTFRDLIHLRSLKALADRGVSLRQLGRALEELKRQAGAAPSLGELRILPSASLRRITVEYEGSAFDPFSGQLCFRFQPPPDRVVEAVPGPRRGIEEAAHSERRTEEALRAALDLESQPGCRDQAVQTYRQVLREAPDCVAALLNLGTLLYEGGDWAEAARYFRRAVELAPKNPLARYDLGCALEELGQYDAARQEWQQAVSLRASYADAHYNLARICELLGDHAAAREHWSRYLQLDPTSPWASHARRALEVQPHVENRRPTRSDHH